MPQFPAADPIPVPAPIWLLKVLHNLTFALHLSSVELLLGGLLLGLVFAALGRFRSSPEMLQASGMIAHRLPTVMAFVINLGIPPLLFAQVLYGRALYTSSVLIGIYWISVIFLLMASYYGLYLSAKRAEARKPWTATGVAALLLVLTIAFIYSNNMSLMIRPQAWIGMFQSSPTGLGLNTSDPTLLPRWFFFIAGAFPVTGAALILFSLRPGLQVGLGQLLQRYGGFAIVAGLIAQAGAAYVALGAQPSGVVSNVIADPIYGSFLYAWIGTAVLLLLIGLYSCARTSSNWMIAGAGALTAFLNVASTVMVRDGIRDATLRQVEFDVWNRHVVTNWSVLGLFLVLFVAALAVIGYLIGIIARARRLEEKYA